MTQPPRGGNYKESTKGNYIATTKLPTTKQDEEPKKRYAQANSAYNRAKRNQTGHFKELLKPLIDSIIGSGQSPGRGRRGYSMRAKLIAMCFREYYGKDLRFIESELKELVNMGYINSVPSYRALSRAYNSEKIGDIVEDLIKASAMPVLHMEETLAIDASSFGTPLYKKVKDEDGEIKRERIPVKLHAIGGTRTNIFVAAKVTKNNVSEKKMVESLFDLPPGVLVTVQKVVADKGYCSRRIVQFIEDMGFKPYIRFLKSVPPDTPPKGCPAWSRSRREAHEDEEAYKKKCNPRSNIEANFHALKTRSGSTLRNRKLNAQRNELLIKVLCHNICVLIQEMYENNITPDFEANKEVLVTHAL